MSFKRSALRALSQQRDTFAPIAAALHRQRCERDILYALFEAPTLYDNLLDRVLQACFVLTSKKYAPDLETSRNIRESRAFLQSPRANVHIKLYNFLFFLRREEEVQEMVLMTYESPEQRESVRAFIHDHATTIVEQTLNWPYSRMNIDSNVTAETSMTHAARVKYLTTSSPLPVM